MSWILRIPKSIKTIGFKIAAAFSLLFSCSFIGLTIFAYLFLEATLSHQERQMVMVEVQSLQEQYRTGGWAAFQNTVLENDRFRKNNPFFVRIIGARDRAEQIFFPQYWKDFDFSDLKGLPGQRAGQWIRLPNSQGTYALEIFTAGHPDATLFQVGISTEDRVAVLTRYQESFWVVAIPLILLAAGGGVWISRRALRPLRNLITTIASIEAGQMDARVRVKTTGDELEELGRLFNRMVDKIHQLIQGMKNALDSVAHDLRTPMTHFRNIAETALQEKHTVVAYREALQECLVESDRILRMLAMLMDISEAEAGTMRLELRNVNLVKLAEGIVDMYSYVAEEKGVRINTDFPGEALLEGDAERVSQVLANLLDNAVKFTPPHGMVHVSIRHRPNDIEIQVTDSGVGILPEEIDKIWDRLYRGSQTSHKGLGLGLSVVKAVVHAHMGSVQVSSVPGSGAVFTVVLPIHGGSRLSA